MSIPFVPAGAIFDFDDTLLDNGYTTGRVGNHERLRLQAVHEIGEKYDNEALKNATMEQSVKGFMSAKVTNFSYALWNMLCILGIRHNPDEPDFDDVFMREITERKDTLYHQLLETAAVEIVGSTEFVCAMAQLTKGAVAIGSAGRFTDIATYLEVKDIRSLFPDRRIISIESVIHAKPDPEVYNKAFASLELEENQRQSVCVFEDDPRGIMAAKAAGLYACAITTRHTKEEFLSAMVPADCVVDSYAEFTELFKIAL